MIHLGTSGYSFRDWLGPFYPPGTRAAEMLPFYARHFHAVEINTTYYRLPQLSIMERMVERTPARFLFTVKLPADMTHRQSRERDLYRDFERILAPLEAAGKFAGALAQFPYSFHDTPESRDFLSALSTTLVSRPLFAEFRHASWARRETFALLDGLGIGFCAVDEPRIPGLFPSIVRPTGPIGYVRFHGRNAADWWGGEGSARYNYLYSDRELQEWVEVIRELDARSRDTFVFFNNCHAGRAAQNAKRMGELLNLPFESGY